MNVEAVVDSFVEIPTADSQSCLVCVRFYVRLCLGEWALGKIMLEWEECEIMSGRVGFREDYVRVRRV